MKEGGGRRVVILKTCVTLKELEPALTTSGNYCIL